MIQDAGQQRADTIDGRTARRHRNRAAVLDAVIELFEAGDLTPGVHDVADRSGVSLRSVYRYFADVDDLILAAIDRQFAAAAPRFETPDLRGSTADRIHDFCDRRIGLFLELRTAYRAAVIRSTDQPAVRQRVERCRTALADQVASVFAADLQQLRDGDADVVLQMLDSLSQFDTIEYLVTARGLQAEGAERFLTGALGRTLCCPAVTVGDRPPAFPAT